MREVPLSSGRNRDAPSRTRMAGAVRLPRERVHVALVFWRRGDVQKHEPIHTLPIHQRRKRAERAVGKVRDMRLSAQRFHRARRQFSG